LADAWEQEALHVSMVWNWNRNRLGVLQLIRLMSRCLILIHDGGMIIDVRYLCGE
jgi:hypothetical protein